MLTQMVYELTYYPLAGQSKTLSDCEVFAGTRLHVFSSCILAIYFFANALVCNECESPLIVT